MNSFLLIPSVSILSKLKWVKCSWLLASLAYPAEAALLATLHTSRGEVVIELQYEEVPKTVANFITLAEGTRAWLDPATGAVRNGPYYNGTRFFAVVNEENEKIAHGGSKTGDGNDNPGFTIKDEFEPALAHSGPYLISMDNNGPNSNGGGFFITGSVAIPSNYLKFSQFGIINSTQSRAVVDSIIAAGANATIINSVTITPTDAAALAFNEHAQGLPVVKQPKGTLTVLPGISAIWTLGESQNTGDIFRAFRSTTLGVAPDPWTELPNAKRQNGILSSGVGTISPVLLENASAPKAFYNLSFAKHPDSVAPSTLANRSLMILYDGGFLRYDFNETGNGGVVTVPLQGGDSFSTNFSTLGFLSHGHGFSVEVENPEVTPKFFLFRVGCDGATSSLIVGRHSSLFRNDGPEWLEFGDGTIELSR